MNQPSLQLDALRNAIVDPTRGIVGLVDDVLTLCREHGLQLDWQADGCHVRLVGSDAEYHLDVPLRKSVFRAILARVATLCDEQTPGAFSPYGGQDKLWFGSDHGIILQLAWVNTPDEQKLTVTPTLLSAESAATGMGADTADRSVHAADV